VEDVKLILNSHVHFDHAGGIAELRKLSGARVAASPWTAAAMKTGQVPKDDPQFGSIRGITPVPSVEIVKDGQKLNVGPLALTAHFTPGHTPGGTTWTWRSCETGRCLNMVYFDSLSAVSTDGYLYGKRKDHPNGPDDFEHSFEVLEKLPCDVLITPHPEVSNLMPRVAENKLVDPGACRALAGELREKLKQRMATEGGK
jgi:metallo-beta-lactamase class B